LNKAQLFARLLALGIGSSLALSGAYLVGPWEGEVRTTYIDPVGIKTVCYGHTGGYVKAGKTYTGNECVEILARDLVEHNREMQKYIRVPINMYQNAAFTSFCFNVGVNACRNSTAFKLLNQFNYAGACAQIKRWIFAGGKVFAGLVNRRGDEYSMCMGTMKGLPLSPEVLNVYR
jgi:lysozyme